MTTARQLDFISSEEYLEGEKVSPIKHEYREGQVFAMSGASDAHTTIAGNLFANLLTHTRARGCRVYMSDMKLRVEASDAFYYPDLFVTCDTTDLRETHVKRSPRLIIEVLSPSTAAFDRGDKFADYRTIASLQEYVLCSQHRMQVECFRRNDEGRWVLFPFAEGDEVHLSSVDFRIPIESIYDLVDFERSEG
jgi:Uma2 family endonuclease